MVLYPLLFFERVSSGCLFVCLFEREDLGSRLRAGEGGLTWARFLLCMYGAQAQLLRVLIYLSILLSDQPMSLFWVLD